MKNYYFILGLATDARDADIKQAYRQLAMQFHPDKNTSPQAEAIFKEVNEAYEILGDPLRKAMYDQLLKGSTTQEAPKPVHRDPRYKPQSQTQNQAKRKFTRRDQVLVMMENNLHYAVLISRATLLFSIILIIDYSLPKVKSTTEIVAAYLSSGSSLKLELKDGKSVSVDRSEAARKFVKASHLNIYHSKLFAVPINLEDEQTNEKIPITLSIYGNFFFWPLLLLITSLLGAFYPKGVEFRFNVGVVNVIFFLLNLVFLQIHKF